ncbi:hypothetical protein ACTFSJ_28560 [Bacillus cereus group sp. MYBK12-2]|uniref:hypothetical protein n=1 Tax=Bacillus cereus group TaxID=86661 RepID=UPI0028528DB6|nr:MULTISPECIES: hypothetical protein [Bacillus cereus group]
MQEQYSQENDVISTNDARGCCNINPTFYPQYGNNANSPYKENNAPVSNLNGCQITLPKNLSTQTTNDPIQFCCDLKLPKNSTINPSTLKFVYDTSCLHVVASTQTICCNSDCGPVDITLNSIKIVGCIPYYLSAEITPHKDNSLCGGKVDLKDNTCDACIEIEDKIVAVCCQGNLCVDHTIGCSTQPFESKDIPNLKKCGIITLSSMGATKKTVMANNINNGKTCEPQRDCDIYTIIGTLQIKNEFSKKNCPPNSN